MSQVCEEVQPQSRSSRSDPAFKTLIFVVSAGTLLLIYRELAATQQLIATQKVRPQDHDGRQLRKKWLLQSKPRPLVVVAAGIPRSGSTWVFNVLRILLRIRDPNSVSGYFSDLILALKYHSSLSGRLTNMTWLEAYRSLNTSLLVKVHGPDPWHGFAGKMNLEQGADVTILTHRDLRTQVRSIVIKKWISRIRHQNKKKRVFENPKFWIEHARRMLEIRNETMASVGSGRSIDIGYEEWNGRGEEQQRQVIRKLADKLSWNFTEDDITATLIEAQRIAPPASDTVLLYNPANQLHAGHRRVDVSHPRYLRAIRAGYDAIEKNPVCRQFLKKYGYL